MSDMTEQRERLAAPRHRGTGPWRLHPLNAILLAFPTAMFAGGLVADIAFLASAEIQWSNFAAWMIAAALLFGGMVLLWAIVDLVRKGRLGAPSLAYPVALGVMWVAGLINAFQHSKDGWSSVGSVGLVLSVLSTFAALVAAWIGYGAVRGRGGGL